MWNNEEFQFVCDNLFIQLSIKVTHARRVTFTIAHLHDATERHGPLAAVGVLVDVGILNERCLVADAKRHHFHAL